MTTITTKIEWTSAFANPAYLPIGVDSSPTGEPGQQELR